MYWQTKLMPHVQCLKEPLQPQRTISLGVRVQHLAESDGWKSDALAHPREAAEHLSAGSS